MKNSPILLTIGFLIFVYVMGPEGIFFWALLALTTTLFAQR